MFCNNKVFSWGVFGAFLLLAQMSLAESSLRDFDIEVGGRGALDYESSQSGEHIDTYTGAIQLTNTDLYIPGNHGMDISIKRVYNSIQPRQFPEPSPYGFGWTISFGRVIAPDQLSIEKVCSQSQWSVTTKDNPSLEMSNGGRELLVLSSLFNDGSLITASNWRMICGGGEIKVLSPDGLTYTMGHFVNDLKEPSWYTTKIEDLKGNSLTIKYGGNKNIESITRAPEYGKAEFRYSVASGNSDMSHLTHIVGSSNDGEQQVWTYNYDAINDNSLYTNYKLSEVIRPDQTKVKYDYYDHVDNSVNSGTLQDPTGSWSIKSITYPYGGKTEYTYQRVRLHPSFTLYDNPYVAAVKTKTVTDPVTNKAGTWTYEFTQKAMYGAGRDPETGEEVLTYLDLLTVQPPPGYPKKIYYHNSAYPYQGRRATGQNIGKKRMEATFEISKEYLIEVKTYSDEDGKRIISQENYNIVGTNEYDDFTYAFSEPGEIVSRDLIEFVFLNGQRVDRIRASHYSGPIEFDQFGQPTKIMESVRGAPSNGQFALVQGRSLSIGLLDPFSIVVTNNFYKYYSDKWLLGKRDYSYRAEVERSESGLNEIKFLNYNLMLFNDLGDVFYQYNSADGSRLDYEYSPTTRLLSRKSSPSGLDESYGDYRAGRPQTVTKQVGDGLSPISELSAVDFWGQVGAFTDTHGYTKSYDYDDLGFIKKITPPRGNPTDVVRAGNKVTITRGNLTQVEELDGFGRLIAKTISGDGSSIKTTYEYDLLGQQTFASLPNSTNGKTTIYDGLGRVKRTEEAGYIVDNYYRDVDVLTEETIAGRDDPDPVQTLRRYSMQGVDYDKAELVDVINVFDSYDPRYPGDVYIAESTGYQRDLDGRLLAVLPMKIAADGGRVSLGPLDKAPTFTYDYRGQLETTFNPEEGLRYFSYESDKYNNTNITGIYDSNPNQNPDARKLFAMEYDNLGRMTKQTDLYSDLVTQWFYDMDRLEGTSAGLSYEDEDARVRKSYFYNENNYLIREITMPGAAFWNGPLLKPYSLVYGYDNNDHMSSIRYPGNLQVNYKPDAFGRPTQALPYVTNVNYHPHGLIDTITYANGVVKSVGYDDQRQLPASLSVKKANYYINSSQTLYGDGTIHTRSDSAQAGIHAGDVGGSYTYQYDAKKRLRIATHEWGNNQATYNYNFDERERIFMSPAGDAFDYDIQNRLTHANGVFYQYDAFGNVNNRITPYGDRTLQLFMTSTPDGRIRQLDTYDYSNTFDDNSWEQVSFRYDANDWRTLKFSGNKGSYTLGISQERKVPVLDLTIYGNSGKLLFSQNFNGCSVSRTAHIYLGNEAVAERTTRGHVEYMDLNRNGIDDCTDEKSGTNSAFNFDAPNLWQGLTQPEGPSIKLSQHQSHKQADAPLSAGMGWLFLLPFLANYLSRGRRYFKQVLFACFMAASGNALAAVTEEITYLHTDLSGSVKAASDKNGNLLWRQEYTPSGAATLPTGQKIGFNNFQQDASGLVYMGARYYDPHIQRFLSPDPASQVTSVESNPMMVNRYAYANNNPVSYLDPDGNNPKLVLDFALNVGINMLVTGQPGFASAAVETAKGAFNPLATVSKVKKLAEAVRAANKVMAERAVVGRAENMTTVGRWMSPAELAKMQKTGKVQESYSGTTHVANPADAEAFIKQTRTGNNYVEFDVPTSSLRQTNEGWAQIAGPNSLFGRLAAKKGQAAPQMPNAENIIHKATKI